MSKKQEKIEPVYFMDLVVENVRCFKDRQVMDLSDGNGKPARWTIILGDNGTGKTTLLKCLALLEPVEISVNFEKYKYSNFPKGLNTANFYNNYSRNKETKLEISSSNLSKGKLSKKENELIGSHYINFLNSHNGTAYSALKNVEEIFFLGYGASRKMGNGSLTETKNIDSTLNLFDNSIPLINAEAWLLETDFAIKSSENSAKLYLQKRYIKVTKTLKQLLPDIEDFRIKKITKTNIQATIEVQTPYGWVEMKNLSLGYQTFITWIVDLAARLFDRYPDSETPLEEPCIVLVDEIDLHLHPKWQRKIIGFLTDIFKNAQFIVTAHSPLIVQAAEDANIVLLKREGDSVKIYNNMDEHIIDDWRFDQILTSELFGLHSARSPKYDAYIERKKEILEKDKLTKKDEKELEKIAEKLEEIPLDDKQANDAIEALKKATAILNAR